jgi:catechol 2,3-dioxygenase-like lactoylglutathione lyase family enzyme
LVFDSFPTIPHADQNLPGNVELGAFSISLNVSDLARSRAFYEALGFVVVGGGMDQNYLILKNGESTIGLFHGMFEGNILTFNPGLTNRMERLEDYLDVRQIEERLVGAGIHLQVPVSPEAGDAGPASITLTDPDGNTILIDQFF